MKIKVNNSVNVGFVVALLFVYLLHSVGERVALALYPIHHNQILVGNESRSLTEGSLQKCAFVLYKQK